MYLEGSRGVEGGCPTEPARGAGEVGIPRLVDQAGRSCPGLGLPEVVEAVGRLCIQPHAEVVEEEPLHLWSTCRPVGACQADTVTTTATDLNRLCVTIFMQLSDLSRLK